MSRVKYTNRQSLSTSDIDKIAEMGSLPIAEIKVAALIKHRRQFIDGRRLRLMRLQQMTQYQQDVLYREAGFPRWARFINK